MPRKGTKTKKSVAAALLAQAVDDGDAPASVSRTIGRRGSRAAIREAAAKTASIMRPVRAEEKQGFRYGSVTPRVLTDGVPLVPLSALADPTKRVPCDDGRVPVPKYHTKMSEICEGPYTFDVTCGSGSVGDTEYITVLRSRQEEVMRFLGSIMFDLQAIDSYSLRFRARIEQVTSAKGGQKVMRALQKAFDDLAHAVEIIESEVFFCTGEAADAEKLIQAASADKAGDVTAETRATLVFSGCSLETTERMLSAAKVLYFVRMKALKELLRNMVAGFNAETFESEWDTIGKDGESMAMRGFSMVSQTVKYRLTKFYHGAKQLIDNASMMSMMAKMGQMTVAALGSSAMWTSMFKYYALSSAAAAFAPVYLCMLLRDTQMYVAALDYLKQQLWNWATHAGKVHEIFRRVFDAFAAWIRTSGEFRSALYRNAKLDTAKADEMERLKRKASTPEMGLLAEMIGKYIDRMIALSKWKTVRFASALCSLDTDSVAAATADFMAGAGAASADPDVKAVSAAAAAGSKLYNDSLSGLVNESTSKVVEKAAGEAIKKSVEILRKVQERTCGGVIGGAASALVDKVVGPGQSAVLDGLKATFSATPGGPTVVTMAMDDAQKLLDRMPKAAGSMKLGELGTAGSATFTFPADDLLRMMGDPLRAKQILRAIISPETQRMLTSYTYGAATTVQGIIVDSGADAGKWVADSLGYSTEEVQGGALLLGGFLLKVLGAAAVVSALQASDEDPLILTAEEEHIVKDLKDKSGDSIELAIMKFGRVTPVPNPTALYERCTQVLKADDSACKQLVSNAMRYDHPRDAKKPVRPDASVAGMGLPDPRVASPSGDITEQQLQRLFLTKLFNALNTSPSAE